MIVRERTFGPCGGRAFAERSAKRDATTKESNKKWRQNLDFERSEKGIFRETRKSTLLEKPISKPFLKIKKLKFCRHFCLHRIHEWFWFCRQTISVDGGPKKFFYARTLRVLAPRILQINITIGLICSRACWEKTKKLEYFLSS